MPPSIRDRAAGAAGTRAAHHAVPGEGSRRRPAIGRRAAGRARAGGRSTRRGHQARAREWWDDAHAAPASHLRGRELPRRAGAVHVPRDAAARLPRAVADSRRPPRPARSESVLAHYDLDAPRRDRWELPKELNEISGLAVDSEGRLFAHDDERAIIYQLDPATHRVVKRFAFGRPAVARRLRRHRRGGRPARPDHQRRRAVRWAARAQTARRCRTPSGIPASAAGARWKGWRTSRPTGRCSCSPARSPRIESLRGRVAVFAWSLERRRLEATARHCSCRSRGSRARSALRPSIRPT